ncbi:hypothetical protein TSOC_003794 [Tetrabaena socialis]|uniref:C-type lectin domain-containing protein n=1 Tax=Tetrabaena socialis TaxID=47790 RepID=A0A2J8AAJ7_9CHLO|nr:hypothetical protein TSOC_003794 [Tetrabaena socialis]|eukprot:PNH09556.1 hypothetical protein TSOC_003794 [Tetrabaena socialis]
MGASIAVSIAIALFAAWLSSAQATPTCDPFYFPYNTAAYYNGGDCGTYTLFDVGAGCMADFATARLVCEFKGLELAPLTEDSKGAFQALVVDNNFTAWVDDVEWVDQGEEGRRCGVMTQEGYLVYQGCKQTVRFVCRTKDANILELIKDGFHNRLYTVDATERLPYVSADAFCKALGAGWGLVPRSDPRGLYACQRLCADNAYTCWMMREDGDGQCPLMDARGDLQLQGCEQDVRFVCRKKL